ncbi:uncharacterized protein LOC131947529 [Physella acuta]|uniref:uncharacterized protein LOC131947529 n=1 Tax=Physella acuta TaxID=109671 RepID=UPI0027DDE743|nr:uncharacterized protein LOC131947529 [Physella acuta]XP_059164754.1 uncharacterized protein LOC131947529 [Physella acuta]XP_059164755.1 uncharacterized protein LOC131947529 [Physella acuta]
MFESRNKKEPKLVFVHKSPGSTADPRPGDKIKPGTTRPPEVSQNRPPQEPLNQNQTVSFQKIPTPPHSTLVAVEKQTSTSTTDSRGQTSSQKLVTVQEQIQAKPLPQQQKPEFPTASDNKLATDPHVSRTHAPTSVVVVTSTPNQKSSPVLTNNVNSVSERLEGFSIYRGRDVPAGEVKIVTDTPVKPGSVPGQESRLVPVTSSTPTAMRNGYVDKVDANSGVVRVFNTETSNVFTQAKQPQLLPIQQKQPQQMSIQQKQPANQTATVEQYVQVREARYHSPPPHRVQSYPQVTRPVTVTRSSRPNGTYLGEVQTLSYSTQRPATVRQRPFSQSGMSSSHHFPVAYSYYPPGEETAANTSPRSSISGFSYKLQPELPSPSSDGKRPKSILKNASLDQQPDWHQNARLIQIPRAQSVKSPAKTREYDFSSILSSRKDAQAPGLANQSTVQVTAQTSRPVTSGSQMTPQQKKSVTFNSQVKLHTEDRTSTVKFLSVDA